MKVHMLILGYLISVVGGGLLLWLLIEKLAWGYLVRQGIRGKERGILTAHVGFLERALYTTAFLLGQPGFVPLWLGLKVASQWRRWQEPERGTFNVFLIGNGLSLAIAYVGAWIAKGSIPLK